jgi:SAM-dependent methyltransferase
MRAMKEMLTLRIWLPGLYGWHLIFVDGVPVGCLSDEGLASIKRLLSTYIDSHFAPDINQLHLLSTIGLSTNDIATIELVSIDPSVSTILSDSVAQKFIPTFYRYFANIFHEGSPFIDSDGDFLPIISRYFPNDPGALCFDIGAGSGYYSQALARNVNKVIACDIAIDRLLRLENQKIEVIECDIQMLPFSIEADFGMCNFVLEHVADPYKVIAEMARNIKCGGRVLLSFPSFAYRDVYAAKHLGELPTLNFEHLRSFTGEPGVHPWEENTSNVLDYIREMGFVILEVRGVNITIGLDMAHAETIAGQLDMPQYSSSAAPPHNMYGQQTIIYAQKEYTHDT